MLAITEDTIETLRKDALSAYEAFSNAWEEHQQAEASLEEAKKLRSRLTAAHDARHQLLTKLRCKAMELAIKGSADFKNASKSVTETAGEFILLDAGLKFFHSYAFQEILCASLESKIRMLDAQLLSEQIRLDQKIGEIEMSFSSLSYSGAQIELAPVIRPHQELIAQLQRQGDAARGELKTAEIDGRELKATYQKETATWL